MEELGIRVGGLGECEEEMMGVGELLGDMGKREVECRVRGLSWEGGKGLVREGWGGKVGEVGEKVMGGVLEGEEGVVMKEDVEVGVRKGRCSVRLGLGNEGEDKEGILGGLKEGKGKGSVGGEVVMM